ncbi:MAG: hypothetical protein P8Z76_20285 [Alphaproteobacteria bacterium]
MKWARPVLLSIPLMCGATHVSGATFDIGPTTVVLGADGYADIRLVLPSDQTTWVDGGLGKLRYGNGSGAPEAHLGEIFVEGHMQIGGSLLAVGTARVEPTQKTFIDFTEAYLRYRPVSLSRWRWSIQAGAFFPPVSLENTDIGWASPWTITPSAINTWVGEELRIIGGAAGIEWRADSRTISITGGVYGWNDPAGVLIADRGWALHDRVTGLLDRLRLPDAWARPRNPVPFHIPEFLEIDDRAGWYAGIAWDEVGVGRIEFLRYDNEANPRAERVDVVAWETDFWSVGATTGFQDFVFIAQGMRGRTFFQPSPFFFSLTDFESAFVLLGLYVGNDWRIAGRAEVFSTDEVRPGSSINLSEHGHAVTAAVNWLPNDWLRLTGEIVHLVSTRRQRLNDGIAPRQAETQVQLSAKVYF